MVLTGSVSSDREHQLVMEVIQEDLGLEDVIDRVGIDDLDSRAYDDEDDEDYEKETAMQGQAPEDDPYSAMDDNESVVPPDELRPEDER